VPVRSRHTLTRLRGELIRAAPDALLSSSSSTPSQRASRQTALRIAAAFSPTPAVNTSASSPPRAATSEPSSRRIR